MSAACPILGFDVRVRLHDAVADAAADALRDAGVRAAGEAPGLAAEGGGARAWRHTVVRDGAQATHADRDAIARWLGARAEVASWQVGPLVDLSDG